jgi:hypothetical protein
MASINRLAEFISQNTPGITGSIEKYSTYRYLPSDAAFPPMVATRRHLSIAQSRLPIEQNGQHYG